MVWLFKFNGWSFSYRIKVKRALFGGFKSLHINFMSMVYWLHADSKHGREETNKDLTCKKNWMPCLLARLKQLLSGHHHRYFLQRKNTTTSIIIPSICSSACHSFIKHSVFNFISSSYLGYNLFFLHSLKMILSNKVLYLDLPVFHYD